MNVYNFDRTIYDGNSTVDFYLFCLKKYPFIVKCIPKQLYAFVLYIFGLIDKPEMEDRFFCFLDIIPSIDDAVRVFWEHNLKKIKEWYLKNHSDTDLIISSSPDFLIEYACSKLGVKLISPDTDEKSGKPFEKKCFGNEKHSRFCEYCSNEKINSFYSDSISDKPLAEKAEKAFIVKGNTLYPWKEYTPSAYEKIKLMFLNIQFLLFLFCGGINVINGVLFAEIFSLFFDANLVFVSGYLLSNIVSYLLNSALTFKSKCSFKGYFKFAVSYIPNFVIQNIIVFIVYNIFNINRLAAYICAGIIGTPITFLLMKIYAFKK